MAKRRQRPRSSTSKQPLKKQKQAQAKQPKEKRKQSKEAQRKRVAKGDGKGFQRHDLQGNAGWKRFKAWHQGPPQVLKVSSKAASCESVSARERVWQELLSVSLPALLGQAKAFPEGWTVKMARPLPQDGRFKRIKQYQDSWEEALLLDTKAQLISEATRKSTSPSSKATTFQAKCTSDTWIFLGEAGRRSPWQDLRAGSIVLLQSKDFASVGVVEMKAGGEKGIRSENLSSGSPVTVSCLGVSLASAAREITAIRELRQIPVILVDQLMGQLPRAEAPGPDLSNFALLETLNPSQTKAVVRAVSCRSGFVSIHGPPGTGKSQALLALVNLMHLRKLQEYHQRIEEMVFSNQKAPERWKEAVCHFPRLLVTAHSNAAVQQLQQRAQSGGFVDQTGGTYQPIHYRLSSAVGEIDQNVDGEINELLSRDADSLIAELKARRKEANRLDGAIVKIISDIRRLSGVCPLPAGFQAVLLDNGQIQYLDESGCQHIERPPAPKPGDPMTQPLQLENVLVRMTDLIMCLDEYRETTSMLRRLELVASVKLGSQGLSLPKLKIQLEASILEFAQIVFATANTTARLGQLVTEHKLKAFDCVVIDEAAQASEPAVLVPLGLCAGRSCVLLGDHLQLPPTLFLPNADELLVSRSLFERLCILGHVPEMLQEQYRMVPEISAFPRSYFYGGRLLDAQEVHSRPRCALIPPFLFLNLASSAERRPDGSWQNKAEASFCVKLVKDLQSHATNLGKEAVAKSIGIITPYRAQKNLIDRLLLSMKLCFQVRVNTIDAFQGQEFEAVICSTVRAFSGGSIGFLRDDRRLNVALTRAKQILLVVGHEETLRQSTTLSALLDHAKSHDAFRNVSSNDDVLLTGD